MHIHLFLDLLHDLRWAQGASHYPSTKGGKVVGLLFHFLQFSYEHRRHSIERGTALTLYRLQGFNRIKAIVGDNHGSPMNSTS